MIVNFKNQHEAYGYLSTWLKVNAKTIDPEEIGNLMVAVELMGKNLKSASK